MDGVFYFGMGIWVVDSKGGSWRQSGGLSQPPWLRRSEANPPSPTKKSTCFYKSIFLSIAKAMVYHQQWQSHCCISSVRKDCISSRVSVYQKFFRNDDIQSVALMICNSLRN